MKSIFIIFSLLLLIASAGKAQTWAEFFKQKKTQQRYLAQQVAGLQMYLSFAKQGYKIVQNELSTISSLKNGDINLHRLHFSRLKHPDAKIRNLALLTDIVQLHHYILNLSARYLKEVAQKGNFSPDERSYQQEVFQKLRSSCAQTIQEYQLLVADNQLELSDDQRISRLRDLHRQMLVHLDFCKSFVKQGMTLNRERTSTLRNVHLELRLYNLNQTL